jgi:hypothetical protein
MLGQRGDHCGARNDARLHRSGRHHIHQRELQFPGLGCDNALVTATNHRGTRLYYDDIGGLELSDAYDFYAALEPETGEVLGTASCITTGTKPLSDGCERSEPAFRGGSAPLIPGWEIWYSTVR